MASSVVPSAASSRYVHLSDVDHVQLRRRHLKKREIWRFLTLVHSKQIVLDEARTKLDVTLIEISYDKTLGSITVKNNGSGIPVKVCRQSCARYDVRCGI